MSELTLQTVSDNRMELRRARLEQLQRKLLSEAVLSRQAQVRDSDLGNAYTQNRLGLYQELIGIYRLHPWTRSGLTQIGRAILGPGFDFVPVSGKENNANPDEYNIARQYFFDYSRRRWDNIKDFYGPLSKIYISAVSIKLFGQAAWETIRNYRGDPIGFDVIMARVEPNVNEQGYFLDPPWFQYSFSSPPEKVPVNNIDDIVYFVMPDIQGYPTGSSDLEALVNLSLPADIQASLAFLNDIKNSSRPEGLWWAAENVSDADFDAFVNQIETMYTGPAGSGRSFISVKGEAGYEPFGVHTKDMMWPEGRTFLRQEVLSVIGTPGSQLGVTEDVNRANVRESRILFFENIVRPLQQVMEEVINIQVLRRDLGINDWVVKFESPDFTTETEDANNAVKMVSWGLASRNEIRAKKFRLSPYPGGDEFILPLNVQPLKEAKSDLENPNPDSEQIGGESDVPGAPALGQYTDTGRPTTGERIYDEGSSFETGKSELKKYKKKAIRLSGNGEPVSFDSKHIPKDVLEFIRGGLSIARDKSDIDKIFNIAGERLEC